MSNRASLTFNEKSKIIQEYGESQCEGKKCALSLFYTDPALALKILNFIQPPKDGKLIDFCCGAGSYLLAAEEYGMQNIYGFDYDREAIKLAQEILPNAHTAKKNTITRAFGAWLTPMGFTEYENIFDAVVGTPPYYRILRNADLGWDKDSIRKHTFKHGNTAFITALFRGFRVCKRDGVISYILPMKILHNPDYYILRRYLRRYKTIMSIIILGRAFKRVREDVLVLNIKNDLPEKGHEIKFYKYIDDDFKFMYKREQHSYTREIIIFHNDYDRELYKLLKPRFFFPMQRLSEYEYIRRGRLKKGETPDLRCSDIDNFRLFPHVKLEKLSPNDDLFMLAFKNKLSFRRGFRGAIVKAGTKTERNVTGIYHKDLNMLYYILAILSSNFTLFYSHRFEFNSPEFHEYPFGEKIIKKFPYVYDRERFPEIVRLCKLLASDTFNDAEERKKVYNKLNQLVYRAMKVPEKYIDYIETEVAKLRVNRSMENFKKILAEQQRKKLERLKREKMEEEGGVAND